MGKNQYQNDHYKIIKSTNNQSVSKIGPQVYTCRNWLSLLHFSVDLIVICYTKQKT